MREYLMLLLLAVASLGSGPASAAEPQKQQLAFSGPKERGPVDQYQFTQYQPGNTVRVGVHEVNLRASADVKSDVVKVLPLGTRVTIKAVATKALRVGYRVDRWYEIEAPALEVKGFLFGGTLTKAGFSFDFDGNGTIEEVSVAWMPSYKIKVRVLNAQVLSEIMLEPGGQAYACCGGVLTVNVVDAKTAGVPLLRIESTVEACGDYVIYHVSFWDGLPRKALEMGGLSDPPSYSEPSVKFFPGKNYCKVVTKNSVDDEEGGEPEVSTHATRYEFKDGVYVPAKKR